MLVANISQFRSNLKDYLLKVTDDHDTLIVNGNGKSVVVMSLEDYNSMDATEYLLSSPTNKKLLKKALDDSNNKKFIPVEFDVVKNNFVKKKVIKAKAKK